MTMPTESWPDARPSLGNIDGERVQRTDERRATDIWQDYFLKQTQLNTRKAAVEALSSQLAEVCSNIIGNGSNAEKFYQIRMLEAGLLQARRQLELAQQQFDAALRMVRAKTTRRPDGDFTQPGRNDRSG